jgi:hypothetical protein
MMKFEFCFFCRLLCYYSISRYCLNFKSLWVFEHEKMSTTATGGTSVVRSSLQNHPTNASTPPRPLLSQQQQQVEDTPQRVIRRWLDSLDLDLASTGQDSSLGVSRSLTGHRWSLNEMSGLGVSGIDLERENEESESVGDEEALLEGVFQKYSGTGVTNAGLTTRPFLFEKQKATSRREEEKEEVKEREKEKEREKVRAKAVDNEENSLLSSPSSPSSSTSSSISLSLPDSFGASYLYEAVVDRVKGGEARVINKPTSCPR